MARNFRIVSDIVCGLGPVGVNQSFEVGYSVKNEGDETAEHRHYLEIWPDGEQQAVAQAYHQFPAMDPQGPSQQALVPFHQGLDEGKYTVWISCDCDSPGEGYQYQESFEIPKL